MFKIFFLMFLILPFLEIYILITVGQNIGAWPTIGLVVFTALVGALIFKSQGFFAWRRVQNALGEGRLPAMELLEGVVILVCGAMLLAPGFITDITAMICLLPPIRRAIIRSVLKRMQVLQFSQTNFSYAYQSHASQQQQQQQQQHRNGSKVIEGEYERDN